MVDVSPKRSWIFALVTLLGVGAVVAFFVLRGAGPSADDAALIGAFERETGLFLRVGSSELSASAGTWRAEDVELRVARDREPVLRAEAVTMQLDVAQLLRGETRIERAVLEGALLTIDLRTSQAKGAVARAVDMTRLHSRLPTRIEAAKLHLRVQTDAAGSFELEGVDLSLARAGKAMAGKLRTPQGEKAQLKLAEKLTPLVLDTAVRWDAQRVELDAARVTLGSSTLTGSARFEGANAFELGLAGDQVDLADLSFMTGSASDPLSGKGRVELRTTAALTHSPTGSAPSVLLDVADVVVRGIKLDRVRASLSKDGDEWVAREVSIERGAERWSAELLALGTLDKLGAQLHPEGSFQVERLELRDVIGVPASAAGTIRLERQGEQQDDKQLAVFAELALVDAEVAKHKFETGQLNARFTLVEERIQTLVIEKLELSSKDVKVAAQGKVSDSGTLELTAKGSVVWAGIELLGDGTVRGTPATPEIAVRVTPTKMPGERGAAQGDLVFALSDKPSVSGTVELSNFDLGAYLPTLEHAGAPSGRLTAKLVITAGRLDDLRSIQGKGEVSALSLGYGDVSFESAEFPLVLRDGRIDLSGVTLASESARWTLRGGIGLDRSVDLKSNAELPLAPLLMSTPYVGAVDGRIAIELSLSGKLDAMTVTGRAEPRAVELEVGPEETRWRKLQGYVSLEASVLHFHAVTGTFGTGTLALGGSIGLAGLRASTVELTMVARKLSFEPQERFQFVLDADTVLSWSRKQQSRDSLPKLTGRVSLSRLVYTRHVQLPEAVIAMGRSSGAPGAATIALDLVLENSAPLVVRNDFLDVELGVARGEPFRIVGTDARLGALGELTVVRGRALFRGAVLTVRDGHIGFRSDERIVPALDLKADAPAKRRPGALILFEAHGDPSRFLLEVRCAPKDGAGSPPPFECKYDGDEMTCGRFEELTALWACEKS